MLKYECTWGQIVKFVDLKNSVAKRLMPAYLITGNDRYLCFDALDTIKSAAALTMPDLNEDILGENASAADIARSACVFPFVDKVRLVEVMGFTGKNKSKGKDDELLKYLQSPSEQCVIVFFSPSGADVLKSYLNYLTVVDCDKLNPESIVAIVKQKLSENGANIDTQALNNLILFCNNDMTRIMGEVEKLISFADGKMVTSDMVKNLVVQDKEYQVFELAEYIAKGDSVKALDLVYTLTTAGKGGFSLLSPLYNNYRRALYVSVNKDKTDAEIASLLGVKEYAVKMVKNQAKIFSPKKLKQIVDMLYKFDRDIKQGRIKEEVAIKTATLNILKIRG